MKNKKLFAHSVPIENFFNLSIPGICSVYWKNLKGEYFGCDDWLAQVGGLTASSVIGKTDFDFTAIESYAKKLRKNDKDIIVNNTTKSFIEIMKYNNFNEPVKAISMKTPMYTSSNHITGMFGFSLMLEDCCFLDILKAFGKKIKLPTPLLLLHRLKNMSKKLTQREIECLYYLLMGNSAREIGEKIHRTPKAIESRIMNIKNKLGCQKKSELINKVASNAGTPEMLHGAPLALAGCGFQPNKNFRAKS